MNFARSKGRPYAPLLRLLENEDLRISLTDPDFVEVSKKSEKSLRGSEQHLRDRAEDLLKRLSAARDRLATIRGTVEEIGIQTTLLIESHPGGGRRAALSPRRLEPGRRTGRRVEWAIRRPQK